MRFSALEQTVDVCAPPDFGRAPVEFIPAETADPSAQLYAAVKPIAPGEERFGILRAALTSGTLPDGPVIGFAACSGNAAASAMLSFGRELAADGKHVVVADLADIQGISVDEVETFDPDILISEVDGLFHWRPQPQSGYPNGRRNTPLPAGADPRIWCVELLRSSFDYTLLETPALDTGLKPALLAALADAVVLVVEAGKSRMAQIDRARKILDMVNANVIGCVLTGRKYPVPNWLYKRIG